MADQPQPRSTAASVSVQPHSLSTVIVLGDATTTTPVVPGITNALSDNEGETRMSPTQAASATTVAHGGGECSAPFQSDSTDLTMGGYRIHPSALAVPTLASGTASAAEQMAAIAASDQGSRNSHENSRPQTASDKAVRCMSDLTSRSLPMFLLGMVAYIYYVFVFRVCIRYYLDRKNDQTLAAIYLCLFNVLVLFFLVSYIRSLARSPGTALKPPARNPPPPIPVLTTPYHPQRVPSNVSQMSLVSRSTHNSTPTNVHLAATSINPSYPSYQATTAPLGSQATTAVSSPQDPVAPKLDHYAPDTTISITDSNDEVQPLPSVQVMDDTVVTGADSNDAAPPTDGNDAAGAPIATLSISKRDGRPRWCDICKIIKPDRCHHCSECDQCVLRMDHHCPWVNGCVGYNNYKFFYLFIFYGSLSAVFVVCTMIPLLVSVIQARSEQEHEKEWWINNHDNNTNANSNGMDNSWAARWNSTEHDLWMVRHRDRQTLLDSFEVQWVIITILSLLMALLIVAFTVMHTSYILTNRTTIETLQDVRATFIKVLYKRSPTEAFLNSLDQSSYQQDRLAGMPLLLPSTIHGPSSTQILFNVVMVEPGERLWDQGSWLANWKSIMGPSWWLWFVPYDNTPGDGIHDIYNEKVYKRLVSDALAQARMQLANIGGLSGDHGTGRGTRPGRGDGGYGTYGSHHHGGQGRPRDVGYHHHGNGGGIGRGSNDSSRINHQGGGKGGSASTKGYDAGSASATQQQRLLDNGATVDQAEMIASSRFSDHHNYHRHHLPSSSSASKLGGGFTGFGGGDESTRLQPSILTHPNSFSTSEPPSLNTSRSPSPDGRVSRATTGARKSLKRTGTAPSTLMPSTVRFQHAQDGGHGDFPRQHTAVAATVEDGSRPQLSRGHSSSSLSPQSYLVPPPSSLSSAKPAPIATTTVASAGSRRHARRRTLSSGRSHGSSSGIGGVPIPVPGFGMGIDGDGIAVNSSMMLRLTTGESDQKSDRSSPSSSRKGGHRRHHSARGSSDPHHHHHRAPPRSAFAGGNPPISPDSDDAFPPPVPAVPREVSTSSGHILPRLQSHDLQQPTATMLCHSGGDAGSEAQDPTMIKTKSVKGGAAGQIKVQTGRQRSRTADGTFTTTSTSAAAEHDEGEGQSEKGSMLSLEQAFPTPYASPPPDVPSLFHSKQAFHSAQKQQSPQQQQQQQQQQQKEHQEYPGETAVLH